MLEIYNSGFEKAKEVANWLLVENSLTHYGINNIF